MADSVKNNSKTVGGVTGKGFVKGQTGNRFGRPKTAHFAESVREYLKKKDGDKTNLQTVLESLLEHDPKVLLYYAFGKPAETMTFQNPDGTALFDQVALAMAQVKVRDSK